MPYVKGTRSSLYSLVYYLVFILVPPLKEVTILAVLTFVLIATKDGGLNQLLKCTFASTQAKNLLFVPTVVKDTNRKVNSKFTSPNIIHKFKMHSRHSHCAETRARQVRKQNISGTRHLQSVND